MYKVLTLDKIDPSGLHLFDDDHYQVSKEASNPDLIILRSTSLHNYPFQENLIAIGRAGVGINNIPLSLLNQKGVAVFNTPGANANAVKELAITGMFMALRKVTAAQLFLNTLESDSFEQSMEVHKKNFVGREATGKTMGIVGLGMIGRQMAQLATSLGMKVIGFDPAIPLTSELTSPSVELVDSLENLLPKADVITLHLPLINDTKEMINSHTLSQLKETAILLNFSRHEVVEESALLHRLNACPEMVYVTDFPTHRLAQHPQVIAFPHLGASTFEAEENCATMVCQQLKDYIETGTINNSVNFPSLQTPWLMPYRLTLCSLKNQQDSNLDAFLKEIFSDDSLIYEAGNEVIHYTIIDYSLPVTSDLKQKLARIPGVVKIRQLSRKEQ